MPSQITPTAPSRASETNWNSVADRVWSMHYTRGYDDGYRQAIRDMLASLVEVSDDFLKSSGRVEEQPRRLLYAFEDRLESAIERLASEAHVVEGGLGI